jgi:four helix bundle protein
MRNPKRLKAFELADQLVLEVYRATRRFPKDEICGLIAQLRRAAVSVPANIVEGCARSTEKDYLHFLNIADGSLAEVGYYLELSHKLGYLKDDGFPALFDLQQETYRVLFGLIRSLTR